MTTIFFQFLNTIEKSQKNYLIPSLVLNDIGFYVFWMIEKFPVCHNKFIADFKEKSETCKFFFIKQCLLIGNESSLPSLFPFITDKSLSDVDFSIEDIKNNKLDSDKSHGDDMISIRTVELCNKSICKPLQILFNAKHFTIRMEKSKSTSS